MISQALKGLYLCHHLKDSAATKQFVFCLLCSGTSTWHKKDRPTFIAVVAVKLLHNISLD